MKKIIAFVALVVVLGFLIETALEMRSFGQKTEVMDLRGEVSEAPMDEYMIEHNRVENNSVNRSEATTGSNNVVASVVFDYRGFDTLGEATVLFTAVAGVAALLRREER